MLHSIISVLPVVVFLVFLILFDSFKLIKPKIILFAFLWGILCAVAAYYINTLLMARTELNIISFSRYLSPLIEESLKMSLIILLIVKKRIGFMIDGAIYGFAIGAGFALFENLYFLNNIATEQLGLWIVRGFGTAIMHGGTTSILSIIIMFAIEQQRNILMPSILGLAIAIIIHSTFNHFILPPIIMMMVILIVIIVIEFAVFYAGKKLLRQWLEMEFDSEVSLILHIRKGKFVETRSGKYLLSIKDKFSNLIVVDMLAYISLYLELSIKAKSNLIIHEAGISQKADPETKNRLNELRSLEKEIGKTGLLAISPILRMSRKDLWKWSLLK